MDIDIAQVGRQARTVPAGKPTGRLLIQCRQPPTLDVLIVAARAPGTGRIDQRPQAFRGKAAPDLAHRAGAHFQPLGDRLGAVPGCGTQQDLHAQ